MGARTHCGISLASVMHRIQNATQQCMMDAHLAVSRLVLSVDFVSSVCSCRCRHRCCSKLRFLWDGRIKQNQVNAAAFQTCRVQIRELLLLASHARRSWFIHTYLSYIGMVLYLYVGISRNVSYSYTESPLPGNLARHVGFHCAKLELDVHFEGTALKPKITGRPRTQFQGSRPNPRTL